MRESPYGGSIIEDEDEIGELEANLTTESCSSCCYSRRSGPCSICKACYDDTRAESSGTKEAGFEDCEDCETLDRLLVGVKPGERWDDGPLHLRGSEEE